MKSIPLALLLITIATAVSAYLLKMKTLDEPATSSLVPATKDQPKKAISGIIKEMPTEMRVECSENPNRDTPD